MGEIIKKDCRYYLGDRPCVFHKQEMVKCGDCPRYAPIAEKILLVKLDATGDVLRTTSILPGLKKEHPGAHLTWITAKASLPLFAGNHYVDRVLPLLPDGLVCLLAERFSLALNFDTAPLSASLLSRAASERKLGFGLDERGRVCALNPEAEPWLEMSVFDDVKKKNRKTYQAIAREIARIPPPDGEILLKLLPEEREFARRFAEERGLGAARPRIGLNTGGGGRWRFKKWGKERTLELARRCAAEYGAPLLLYGGPEEEERNAWILAGGGDVLVDTGTNNSLREFFALLTLPELVVCSDTLALHAALALGKKVVALFGPTSAQEIELYGRGEKVIAPVPCQCCYRPDCREVPNCMESITPEMVLSAIRRIL